MTLKGNILSSAEIKKETFHILTLLLQQEATLKTDTRSGKIIKVVQMKE